MTDTISVTIQEDPMPVLVDTGTAAITITDSTTNKVTVIEADPVYVSVANGNPSVTINNGGYSGTVSVLLSDLVGKLTRTQMEPGLLSDLSKLESLWIRLGNDLILSYPDGVSIQEAGTAYTDSSIISAVADIEVSVNGKLDIAYTTITQTADAIDSRVTSIEGTTDARMEVAESRILQTEDSITSTVSRLDTIDGPGGDVELLQSSISQTEASLSLEVSAREQVGDDLVTAQSSISLLSDSISLYTTTLDTLNDRVTSSEIILGTDGINLSVIEQGLADYAYSLSTVQTQLSNQWGVTIEEDINGNKYTSGFGILVHPTWLIEEVYAVDDTIIYDDVVYQCLIAHTASSSNVPSEDIVTWVELPNGVKSEFTVNAESFQVWTNDGFVPMFTVANGQATINGALVVQSIESDDYNNSSLPGFKLDPTTGAADFRGMTLTIGSGSSGYANISDKPQSLADISASEYALLGTAGNDSVRVSWFYTHVPTLLNAPVTDWDVVDYDEHVGDLYFDTFNNNPYFFTLALGVYGWESLVDPDIALSLLNAADAQDTADGKITFFYDTPVPPYQLGDFWDHTDGLKVCTTARATGSLITTDWTVKATNGADWDINVIGKPSDEEILNSAAKVLSDAYTNAAEIAAKAYADGIITDIEQNAIDAANTYADAQDIVYQTTVNAYADGVATAAENVAISTAQIQADAAENASKAYTDAVEITTKAYADGIITDIEQDAIDAANEYADAQDLVYQTTVKAYADGVADAAESAAILAAQAQADAAEVTAKAYADGIITDIEQNAIDASNLYADAQDIVYQTTVNVYADGVATAAEEAAILAAQIQADAAEASAKAYTDAVEITTKAYADGIITDIEQNSIDAANAYADAQDLVYQTTVNAYADGIVTQAETDAITEAQLRIDALEIGGVNLLLRTKDFDAGWWSTGCDLDETEIYNSLTPTKAIGHYGYRAQTYTLEAGKTYTFSGWIKTNIIDYIDVSCYVFNRADNTTRIVAADTWQKFSFTFEVGTVLYPEGTYLFRLESGKSTPTNPLWVCGLKLELGDKTTDWTMALEDIEAAYTDYTDAVTVVEQLRADLYADGVATTAKEAAILAAQAQADAAETTAKAYADGIITNIEQDAIDAANLYADAQDIVYQTTVNAYADGIVNAEETRAILDATTKAEAARVVAQGYTEGWSNFGATVGASWDTDITGQPNTLSDLDTTAANELATALSNSIQAISDASTAQDTADGKITSFYQDTEPTTGMNIGDFWIDTNDNNKLYRYTGSAWVSAQDNLIGTAITAAQTAQTTADGKAVVYYSDNEPTGMSAGDLWYDTNDEQKRLYRYNGSIWAVIASYGANWSENVTGAPTDLSTLNLIEGTKLENIQENATNGATWGTNIADEPTLGALAGLSKITDTVIDSNAISASKINATNLAALSGNMGTLNVDSTITVGSAGSIKSSGKDWYGDTTSGFYLGNYAGGPAFNVGDANKYFQYRDGSIYIGGDIIATGNIKAKNITTATIADQAVTIPVSSFVAGPTACYYNVEKTLASAYIVSDGNSISVDASTIPGSGTWVGTLKLYRSSTLLLERLLTFTSEVSCTFVYVDKPGSGGKTYYLKVKMSTNAGTKYYENSIVRLLETKK